jgi:hypothetical protein
MSSPSMSIDLLRSLVATLPRHPGDKAGWWADRVAAAKQALADFKARDAVEAMLATQAVATHAAIMECYRLGIQDASDAAGRRQRGSATGLMRCLIDLLRVIERRQLKELPLADGALAVPEVELAELEPRPGVPAVRQEAGQQPMHREDAPASPPAAPRFTRPAQFTPVVPPRIVELMTPAERLAFLGQTDC